MEIEIIRKSLDSIMLRTEKGGQYWMARDLQENLAYSRWEDFEGVILKAIQSCESVGIDANNHFRETPKVVKKSNGVETSMKDYYLTKPACYLIAMCGDTSKPEIAFAQIYFTGQTIRQETFDAKTDEEKRLILRQKVKDSNKNLMVAAKNAGVINYGLFNDAGYRGLYEMGLAELKKKKGLDEKEELLDRAGRLELGANEFRILLTEEKIKNESITKEKPAIDAHHYVGQEVRKTIQKVGINPENLPVEPSIKKLTQQKKKEVKQLPKK